MGGLGPGIGGLEYVVIGLVALLVLGPERLPVMLRKLGQMVAKARNLANEFRASFDDMARQAELDELRKEVEALKRGQDAVSRSLAPLGQEAEAAFRDIGQTLNEPSLPAPVQPPDASQVEPEPAIAEAEPAPEDKPGSKRRKPRKAAPSKATAPKATKPAAKTRKPATGRADPAPRKTASSRSRKAGS